MVFVVMKKCHRMGMKIPCSTVIWLHNLAFFGYFRDVYSGGGVFEAGGVCVLSGSDPAFSVVPGVEERFIRLATSTKSIQLLFRGI